ncbi:hypothetical protein FFLO_05862 [Filobasidium floriforme]|uniref:Uncharacterized protein n=1 Tax=Filobasidium floriforme TaxID=5210 RepID=A0A8K0NNF6_9TREE|nr:uncharacterized protein HD553DRAFT_325236 [Filobasidium floriforme]KAG7528963.1 hypothetical protein FFLO_05862 [Filobasidium floriforme]KAH8081753.1 hypothetical protein HD553DRAFT_325236 [Filobasidium floriforme]
MSIGIPHFLPLQTKPLRALSCCPMPTSAPAMRRWRTPCEADPKAGSETKIRRKSFLLNLGLFNTEKPEDALEPLDSDTSYTFIWDPARLIRPFFLVLRLISLLECYPILKEQHVAIQHLASQILRGDLIQSVSSAHHLFAVTPFYILKIDQNSHEQLPDSSANGPAHSFAQDLCPSTQDCSLKTLHGESAHSGSFNHPAQSETSDLQSTSSSHGNSRRTFTRPSTQFDDQSGLNQPVRRQPREEVMKLVNHHLNKNPHLYLKPGIVDAIVNEWSTWDAHFPMTQAISHELETSTRASLAQLLFYIQGEQNATFYRQVRIVVLCEVILKGNDLEPERRSEDSRVKAKTLILKQLREVGAGMYPRLAAAHQLPNQFIWTANEYKTAQWAAQMMADSGITYKDLDSSWFVQAASAMILNKHNIGIALYNDDSDTTEEEESADSATADRTTERSAEENSGILPASVKSLCAFL